MKGVFTEDLLQEKDFGYFADDHIECTHFVAAYGRHLLFYCLSCKIRCLRYRAIHFFVLVSDRKSRVTICENGFLIWTQEIRKYGS